MNLFPGGWNGFAFAILKRKILKLKKTLQVFKSGTVLYSIHVTERISYTFCEIVSTKICKCQNIFHSKQ